MKWSPIAQENKTSYVIRLVIIVFGHYVESSRTDVNKLTENKSLETVGCVEMFSSINFLF